MIARKVLARGDDPGELRKAGKAQTAHDARNTLLSVAGEWLQHQTARSAPITVTRITASLKSDIYPTLGDRPIASVKPGEIMAAVKLVEARGAADQAGRVLQRVKSIYRWAVTHGCNVSNPMVDLVPSEILKPRTVTHRQALARMGYKGSATAHGFRALFSTVANECNWNPDTIECQLAHVEANKVRAAYHRSTYLDDRAKLMQWWADYRQDLVLGVLIEVEMTVPLHRVEQNRNHDLQPLAADTSR